MSSQQPVYSSHTEYKIDTNFIKNRIKIEIDGLIIANSEQVLLLQEQDHQAVYYFPESDVNLDLFQKTKKISFCPYKGNAEHYSLSLEKQIIRIAAWCYREPYPQVSAIQNCIAFYAEIMQFANFIK